MSDEPTAAPSALASELISIGPPLWRVQLVRVLQIIGILLGFLGAAELLDLINILPQGNVSKWLLISGPTFSSVSRRLIEMIGDVLDDGIRNDSFKLSSLLLPFALAFGCLALPSCAGITSGITGQPVPTTPVSRVNGPAFNIATADLYRAESQPLKAWGLYDAGVVADFTGQVVDSGK